MLGPNSAERLYRRGRFTVAWRCFAAPAAALGTGLRLAGPLSLFYFPTLPFPPTECPSLFALRNTRLEPVPAFAPRRSEIDSPGSARLRAISSGGGPKVQFRDDVKRKKNRGKMSEERE